jgi:hypothetical protein
MEPIIIKFNRAKLAMRTGFAILFLIAGIWVLYGNYEIIKQIPKLNDPVMRGIAGFGGILVGAIGILFMLKCFISKKPGFEVDQNGIIDNSSAFPKGRIYWNEMQSLETKTVGLSFIKMKVMRINLNDDSYKDISPYILNISFDELYTILNSKVN